MFYKNGMSRATYVWNKSPGSTSQPAANKTGRLPAAGARPPLPPPSPPDELTQLDDAGMCIHAKTRSCVLARCWFVGGAPQRINSHQCVLARVHMPSRDFFVLIYIRVSIPIWVLAHTALAREYLTGTASSSWYAF